MTEAIIFFKPSTFEVPRQHHHLSHRSIEQDLSMAIRCSSPCIIIPRKTSKTVARVFMFHNEHIKPSRITDLSSKSIMVEKVFEDQAIGIVCYRDEKGEITCEGYDEGPRFSQQAEQNIHHTRFARHKGPLASDFIQPSWLHNFGEVNVYFPKGVAVGEQN